MMQNEKVKRIGITGGIGSGKSEVSKYLISLGYPLIDADLVAREVVEPGEIGLIRIVEAFGTDILNYDHTLNRQKLGELIFNNDILRQQLNDILHPHISQRISQMVDQYSDALYVFIDVPLLFETESKSKYDEVLLVYASPETCLKRIIERDKVNKEFAQKKIQAQMPIDIKRAMADYVITNDDGIDNLHAQIDIYLTELNHRF